MYTIELDCEPFAPRPDDLIGEVLAGTGLVLEDLDARGAPFFGCKTFYVKPEAEVRYAEAREKVQAHVVALYEGGRIRYGSW